MSKNWMILLQEQNQLSKVIKTNESTEQFGLFLTEQDARLILEERKNSLVEQKRIEFGEGIATKIIYEFCDSDYIHQSNYVETIIRLQEIFYLYKNEIDNICETVFTYVTGHILTGKTLTEFELEEVDYSYIQELFMQATLEDMKKRLEATFEIFIKNYYEGDRELLNYLSSAIDGIVVRLKNTADNNALDRMI